MIPSTKEILEVETITEEEYRDQSDKFSPFKNLDERVQFEEGEEVEDSLKDMIPRFVRKTNFCYRMETTGHEINRAGAFEHSYPYNTFLGKLLQYYSTLYRIFQLEYFNIKCGAPVEDILLLENSVLNGIPFWEDGNDDLFLDPPPDTSLA